MWGISDRRHFMTHLAGATAFGMPALNLLSDLYAAAGPVATPLAKTKRTHKSLIIINLQGGAATRDFFDLKIGHANNGSSEAMKTAASGIEINKLLPTIADQMKNMAIIRSNTKTEGDHMRGTQLTHTGRSPNPLTVWPSLGATLSFLNKELEADLPSFISIGGGNGAMGPGFLGMKFAPFTVQNPGQPPENIKAPQGVDIERRASLFNTLEGGFKTGVAKDASSAHAEIYEKALSLVVSKNKEVFSLTGEDAKLMEAYGAAGTGASAFGRSCILARKLVEAGASCVELSIGGWDMHANIFAGLARQLPIVDKGVGTLVKDLNARGLGKEVVVVMVSEFDRTPRINQNGGRDHYPRTNSVLLGGGLIKGGQVYGSTDSGGESVTDKPVTQGDLFATLYAGLAIDPTKQVRDNLGRPSPIAGEKAKIITDLVG